MFPIRFIPEERTYSADNPTELFLAAASCDIWVEQPCGSKAICGKCKVRVRDGAPAPTTADRNLLSSGELAEGWRLACQLELSASAVVEIPAVTRSVAAKTFGDPAMFAGREFVPNVQQRHLTITPPDEEHQQAELDLLAQAAGVKAFTAELPLLRSLPALLRENHYSVSAVWEGSELIDVRPPFPQASGLVGQPTRPVGPGTRGEDALYGAAVDLGSTTLAAALVDLRTGGVLAAQSRLNPQVKYGGDIISRIFFAQEHADGNERLHRSLIEAVNEMLVELAAQAGISAGRIYAVAFAGNPTMMHSTMGVDVTPLGQAPYVGLWTREQTVKARDLGLRVHERALARFLPMIRSHVGADTVAGILAAGMDRSDGWRLLIDLGTNSEVVVGCRSRMVATSTAAGPAFEGANIYQGMRAAPGAIDAIRVTPDGRVAVKTVANEPAIGICGSGLIDAGAEFCRAGMIAPSGYMRGRHELQGVPEQLAERVIVLDDGQRAIRLAEKVVLTAQDVRQLQLIKGSIAAGVEILLQHLGLKANDLEEVHVAGAFGNFVRKTSAQAIGLVPPVDPERVRFIGNAAGAGARMVLVDADARERSQRIAAMCEYVELAGHPAYQDAFCAAIPFPATDEHR